MSKLSKMDLIKRWQTSECKNKRDQIIHSLIGNKAIGNLSLIDKINGYHDLRGLFFDNKTKLSNVKIKDIDFSFSNFNCLILDECIIENVIFEMCDCHTSSNFPIAKISWKQLSR